MIQCFLMVFFCALFIAFTVWALWPEQSKPQPKPQSGGEWYNNYVKSCVVPEWMLDLNTQTLNVGDRIICLQYGRYGLQGTIESICEKPVCIAGQKPKQVLHVSWEGGYKGSISIKREHVILLERKSATKKKKRK